MEGEYLRGIHHALLLFAGRHLRAVLSEVYEPGFRHTRSTSLDTGNETSIAHTRNSVAVSKRSRMRVS